MKTKRKSGGFTLAELVVVIVVTGILAAAAVPAYNGYVTKAREAADAQLLAEVNKAFVAACLAHGAEPADVLGATAPLDKKGCVARITPDEYNRDFMGYYGGNADTPFQIYKVLRYESGEFIGIQSGGYTTVTATVGGEPVELKVSNDDIIRYSGSSYADMGTDRVMDEVNNVVLAAKASLAGAANNPSLNGEFLRFLKDKYDLTDEQINGLSGEQRANALVMMVASQVKGLDAKSIVGEYNETGAVSFSLTGASGGKPGDNDLTNMASGTTLAYALTMAYVNSDQAGALHTGNFKAERFASKEEAEQRAAEVGAVVREVKSAKWAATPYAVTHDTVDAKKFFYEGGRVNRSDISIGGGLAGANHMSTTNDVTDMSTLIIRSDGFKEYMASGQGEKDLDAFFSAMTMLDENSHNIDTMTLLSNGFADEQLKGMIGAALGN